ncbi:MAG: site-specific integrase [Prevotella sp.]|nr:site-specific integrase [Prevotella sp.]
MVTSIKVKFRPSSVDGKEGCIYYQVIHSRMVRQVNTAYKVFADEWDEQAGSIRQPNKVTDRERVRKLNDYREQIGWDIRRLRKVVSQFSLLSANFSADDIVAEYQRLSSQNSLERYLRDTASRLTALGRVRTAETYLSALNSFMRFTGDEDVSLDGITPFLMQQYEAWLKSSGASLNTISFYMRKLRAVYNQAVERGLTEQCYPFRHVYTGKDKTAKRAVHLSVIRKVKSLKLTDKPALEFARDMFLFSFYTRGMSFVDMAGLRLSNLKSGSLVYRRHKTGQQLVIKWEKCMKDLVGRYADQCNGDYLLPIITEIGEERKQYKQVQYRINYHLKQVSELAGITPPLTMYVARHSWASIAKEKNVPEGTISDALGHDSEKTTRIYLAELDASQVDKANKMILDDL